MKLKFKLKDACQFGWEGLKGWSFNSKEEFERASAAMFEVSGKHGRVKSLINDRVYLVLKGKNIQN